MYRIVLLGISVWLISCSREGEPPLGEMELGVRAFHAGFFEKAVEHYEQALKTANQAQQQAELWNLIGMAYRFSGDSSESKEKEIAAFSKAVELAPDFLAALINLASSYYFSGQKVEAIPYLKRALELAPNHSGAERLKNMIDEKVSGFLERPDK